MQFALRLINAQRSCIISMVDDVVRGSCDLDAKMAAGEQSSRPMWVYRYDMAHARDGYLDPPTPTHAPTVVES